jgi:hypothetical protein
LVYKGGVMDEQHTAIVPDVASGRLVFTRLSASNAHDNRGTLVFS